MPNQHIIREFDNVISALKAELLTMAAQTRLNLERAMRALMERNDEIANSVIAEDDEVDSYERTIDKHGMEILVKYQPMASDLRLVISSMKISMNLERISDHAVNIAKRAKKISTAPQLSEVNLIEPLYTLADHLLRDAISSYSDGNAQLGASLHTRDKELDKMHKQTTAVLSTCLEEIQGHSQEYLHLILIVRSLERIGDLACNIGEDVVYLERAKDIRHMSNLERDEITQED